MLSIKNTTMAEYIFIIGFIIAVVFVSSFVRKKYRAKYKWYDIVTHSLSLAFFILIFILAPKHDPEKFNPDFRFFVVVFLSSYLLYKIYKDIRKYRSE